jgi:hypothetical protein
MIGRGRLCVAAPGLFYRETRRSVLRSARPLRSEGELEARKDKRPRQIQISCSTVFYGKSEAKFRRSLKIFVRLAVERVGIDRLPSNKIRLNGCNPVGYKRLPNLKAVIHDDGKGGIQKVASNFTGKSSPQRRSSRPTHSRPP